MRFEFHKHTLSPLAENSFLPGTRILSRLLCKQSSCGEEEIYSYFPLGATRKNDKNKKEKAVPKVRKQEWAGEKEHERPSMLSSLETDLEGNVLFHI